MFGLIHFATYVAPSPVHTFLLRAVKKLLYFAMAPTVSDPKHNYDPDLAAVIRHLPK